LIAQFVCNLFHQRNVMHAAQRSNTPPAQFQTASGVDDLMGGGSIAITIDIVAAPPGAAPPARAGYTEPALWH